MQEITSTTASITNDGIVDVKFIGPVTEESIVAGNGINLGQQLRIKTLDGPIIDEDSVIVKIDSISNIGIIKGVAENEDRSFSNGNGILASPNSLEIGKIENIGMISGESKITNSDDEDETNVYTYDSGNGMRISGRTLNIDSIENSGAIKGENVTKYVNPEEKRMESFDNVGNGIILGSQMGPVSEIYEELSEQKIALINNSGMISGKSISDLSYSNGFLAGNGLVGYGNITIDEIKNEGVISGYSTEINMVIPEPEPGFRDIVFSSPNGNGIVLAEYNQNKIENFGVIKGSNKGIFGDRTETNNYGVIAGTLDSDGIINNQGLLVTVDATGAVTGIVDGTAGLADGKTIVNGAISGVESVLNSSALTQNSNLIVNGASAVTGALNVDADTTLTSSIINGYNSAVYLNGDKTFTGTDVIFNGGGLKNDVAVIKGDGGNNTINILGDNSIVNGNIDLGAGDDNLAISNSTQVNGDLFGGEGVDKLALGDGTFDSESLLNNHDGNVDGTVDYGDYRGLAIYNTVSGFENIDVKGAVTLYETAKIVGDTTIAIGAGSSLNLRIDPTLKDSAGRVIGHALYTEGDKTITTEVHTPGSSIDEYKGDGAPLTGGTLNIITNGLGTGGVIAMSSNEVARVAGAGTTTLDPNKENLYLRTDSIIHSATVKTDTATKDGGALTGDIVVTVNPDLIVIPEPEPEPNPEPEPEPNPEPADVINYNQLNRVYRSLIANGYNIDALNPTVTSGEFAFDNLLHLLNEIYTNSPYSYSNELSRQSMNLYADTLIDNPFKARDKKWMVYGGLLHENTDLDNSYETKNFHQFKLTEVDVENKVTGAYALAEYGLDSSLSLGGILGGSNNKSDISNGSSLDGDAFYIGTYFKKDIENLRILGGVGYQFTNYDSKRIASNSIQSFSFDDSYDDKGLNIYLSGKYNYSLGNDYYLVPKVKLSYTNVSQDSVNEDDKPLAMEVGSKSFNVFEGSVGLDFKKEFLHTGGKSALKLGADYTRIFKGGEDKYLVANMKGGEHFDLLVPNKVKNRYSVGAGYEFENEKGILFNFNTKYSFKVSEDEGIREDVNGDNSRRGLSIGAGIGYRY